MTPQKKNNMKWKLLSSRTVIKDNWVHLTADDCQMPNGTMIAPFYVSHAPDFVVVIAVTEDGKMPMIWQYRHGLQEVLLEVPAGCVEPGESFEEAAKRELLEETGYQAENVEFLCKTAPNASCLTNYAWCYLAKGAKKVGGQHLDVTEEIAVELMEIEQVKAALRNGGIQQAVHMAAMYRAFEVLDEEKKKAK